MINLNRLDAMNGHNRVPVAIATAITTVANPVHSEGGNKSAHEARASSSTGHDGMEFQEKQGGEFSF